MSQRDESVEREASRLLQLYLTGQAREEDRGRLFQLTRERMLPRLRSLCARTNLEAEEIFHEAFGKALANLATLSDAARYFPWFHAIARNEFFKARRHSKRESPIEESAAPQYREDPSGEILLEEVREYLSTYANRRDAEIFLYRWGSLCGDTNHTLQEAADHFGLSVGRVHQITRKVSKWVQSILDD